MDIVNILKITVSLAACIFAFVAGIIEIKKDPKALLNRYFAGFIMFLSLGLLFYTLYHLIFDIPTILVLVHLNYIFFNLAFACLFMVPKVIQLSSVDPRLKTYAIMIFTIMIGSLFLLIFYPLTVDEEDFASGVVGTNLNIIVLLLINLFRILILFYALGTFLKLRPKVSGVAHRRINHFTLGLALSFVTIFGAIFASVFGEYEELVKMFGLIIVIISTGITLRGFLLSDDNK